MKKLLFVLFAASGLFFTPGGEPELRCTTQRVEITLGRDALGNRSDHSVSTQTATLDVEPGAFEISADSSSRDLKLMQTINIE